VGRWDQNGSYGDWLGGCGLDSTGLGQGPVAGCCECGDEPSGSCATELVIGFIVTAGQRCFNSCTLILLTKCNEETEP
jgi:hypothetical protein